MTHSSHIITLTTDFGLRDGFVGVMKGVIVARAPQAHIIDISHDIRPFDTVAAGFLLEWAFSYFPQGTVHTVVVDPGVGTTRDVLAFETKGQRILCPDNGILSSLWADRTEPYRLVVAENRALWLDEVSGTFHGRDIFAPLAAFLATGGDLSQVGSPRDQPAVMLPPPQAEFGKKEIQAEIVYIDRFGNLVTTIRRNALLEWLHERNATRRDMIIQLGTSCIHGISDCYGAVEEGLPVVVFDGYGRLEIAINLGRADRVLNAVVRDRVTVSLS